MRSYRLVDFLKRPVNKIREINRRYSKPRIKLSRGVKFSLLMLRLYLVVIVLLLLFKLITLLGGR